jgi:RecA/RadA recombinase
MVVTTGNTIVDVTRIPTGIPPLDLSLGGGIPENRITELFGPPGSCKSIVASLILARGQHISPDLQCVWIAVEPFDPVLAKKFGVDIGRLLLVNPGNAEQVIEISERLMAADDCGLVVLDSFAALDTQMNNSKQDSGDLAIVGRRLFHKVVAAQRKAANEGRAPTFVFTNQVRWKNGEMNTPGGFAPKHAAAIRLRLSAKDIFDKNVHRFYRDLRLDRRTAFDFGWLAAARFVTGRVFTGAFFWTLETFLTLGAIVESSALASAETVFPLGTVRS